MAHRLNRGRCQGSIGSNGEGALVPFDNCVLSILSINDDTLELDFTDLLANHRYVAEGLRDEVCSTHATAQS